MDCIRVSQNIEDYLHGDLGLWRRQAVARHIDSCAACSAGVEFEARYRQLLFAKCREEAPPALRDRVMQALEAAALPADLDGLDGPDPGGPFGGADPRPE